MNLKADDRVSAVALVVESGEEGETGTDAELEAGADGSGPAAD